MLALVISKNTSHQSMSNNRSVSARQMVELILLSSYDAPMVILIRSLIGWRKLSMHNQPEGHSQFNSNRVLLCVNVFS